MWGSLRSPTKKVAFYQKNDSHKIGASMSEPHIDELDKKKSACTYVYISICMYVCKFDTNFTYSDSDHLHNGFSGRVQNSSRASN